MIILSISSSSSSSVTYSARRTVEGISFVFSSFTSSFTSSTFFPAPISKQPISVSCRVKWKVLDKHTTRTTRLTLDGNLIIIIIIKQSYVVRLLFFLFLFLLFLLLNFWRGFYFLRSVWVLLYLLLLICPCSATNLQTLFTSNSLSFYLL